MSRVNLNHVLFGTLSLDYKLLSCEVGMGITLGKPLVYIAAVFAALSCHATTVLWDEDVNGTLDPYAEWPTNANYIIRPIGVTVDDVCVLRSSVTLTPYILPFGYIYGASEDAFFFVVPEGKQLVGLALTETSDYNTYARGGFFTNATDFGVIPGTEYGWWARQINGTNDIFALLGIGPQPSGSYMLNPGPSVDDPIPGGSGPIPGPATVRYTLYIFTAPAPTLSISQSGTDVKISWATNYANGFSLQSTTNVAAPLTWVSVTNSAAEVGGRFEVTTPTLSGQRFFRLIKQ